MDKQRDDQLIFGFVSGKIQQLDEDTPWAKAMLAKLRRSAGKGLDESPEVWEAALSGLPEELYSRGVTESYAERAIHTALTLFALHRQGSERSVHDSENKRSFGDAAARLVSDENEAGVRRRFDAVITAADISELSHHARGLIQQMRASDVPIKLNYAKLATDLFFYQISDQRDSVRLKWGRDFHRLIGKTRGDRDNDKKK